jgi:(2Fe-2S) ferredoxin
MIPNAENLLPQVLAKIGLAQAQKHLFLCLGPDCCSPELGQASWDYLKAHLKENNLQVLRTQAKCFRICSQGPLLLIYPEGIWYSRATPERLQRILQEHVIGGTPIQEWIIAQNDLT